MDTQILKKLMRGIKIPLAKLEEKAIKDGIDIASPEYEQAVDKMREVYLAKHGYILEEYKQAKEKFESERIAEKEIKYTELKESLEKIANKLDELPDKIKMIELYHSNQKETHKLLKELTEEVKKKEQYEISISSEDRLKLKGDKGERGSKFLGSFKTIKDLPNPDMQQEGDSVYIEDIGEIWYIGKYGNTKQQT